MVTALGFEIRQETSVNPWEGGGVAPNEKLYPAVTLLMRYNPYLPTSLHIFS
jgi:hypothetical protein